jgi:rubrerythrin
MKAIKILTKMIAEELEGAEHYVKCAIHYKAEMPSLADVFYEISTQEMRHVNILHEEVVKIIRSHRERHGEPPAAMQAVYDWEHEKQIEESKEIKILQNQYREMP